MYKYNQTSKSIIYSHISASMKRPVTEEDIVIMSVSPSTNPKGDTEIRLQAVDGGIFSGTRLYYYNRVDINLIVNALSLSVPYDNYANSYEVLSALNAKYGFALIFSEIVKEDYDNRKRTYYELTIDASSYVWRGVLKVFKDPAPNSLEKLLVQDSVTAPLVTGYRRGKLTGELLYKPYEFNSIRDRLEKLVPGGAQEYVLLDILKTVIADPWEYKPGVPSDWNIDGCTVELIRQGVYRVVRIHLTNSCLFVDGFLELKYV